MNTELVRAFMSVRVLIGTGWATPIKTSSNEFRELVGKTGYKQNGQKQGDVAQATVGIFDTEFSGFCFALSKFGEKLSFTVIIISKRTEIF